MRYGIDVSEHQGSINWVSVAKSGVDFTILRTGYGRNTKDKYFNVNVSGASKAGVKIEGVYHFSYALSPADALIEANFVLDILNAAKLPKDTIVYFDYEYDSERYSKDKGVKQTPDTVCAIAKTFLDAIKNAGYKTGLYANEDWFINWFKSGKTLSYNSFWYADWRATPNKKLTDICDYHQTSEKDKVDGIGGYVDGNYALDKLESSEKPKKSNEELAQEVIKGLWGNGGARRQRLTDAGYSYKDVQAIVDKLVEEEKKKSAKKSNEEIAKECIRGDWGNGEVRKEKLTVAGYSYDEIQPIVNRLMNEKSKKVAPASEFSKSYDGTYEVTAAALNMRYIPGVMTQNNIEKILNKGERVLCYGYYSTVNRKVWLYIQSGNLTGHIDASFVKKV